jgi:hypothetical protein
MEERMNRKLLLSSTGFPEKFISSSITPPNGVSKQSYIEEEIIKAINKYNSKLNISSVKYENIRGQFPHLNFFGKYAGLIVEDIEIREVQEDEYKRKGCFVWEFNSQWYASKSVIYVFISDNGIRGRNITAQLFFPELIDFMELYISSPSFSIANHPIYFINFLNERISASSIIKQIAGMIVSDIDNIEVFHRNTDLTNVPNNIREFLIKFVRDFTVNQAVYITENYEIDLQNKITKIKVDKLIIGDYLEYKNGTDSEYTFKGSSEKFYWIEILPIAILSWKSGYSLDYTSLEDFYNSERVNFSQNDEKIERFNLLIQFIKKLCKGISNV